MHTKKYIIGVFAATIIAAPVTTRAGLQVAYDGNAKLGSYCYSEQEGQNYAYRVFKLTPPSGGTFYADNLPGEDECQPTLAQQKDSHCWFDVYGGEIYHCENAYANNTDGCTAWGSSWDNFDDDLSIGAAKGFVSCLATRSNPRVCTGTLFLDTEITGNFTCQITYDYTWATFGCKAGYYASSGSGQDIICTACPDSGQSVLGNTAISGCYKSCSGSSSDTSGNYTFENGTAYYQP